MCAAKSERLVTPEEFMRLPEFYERYELREGRVTAKPLLTFAYSEYIHRLLMAYFEFDPDENIGLLRASVTMQVSKTGDFLLPDLSFWLASRPKRSDIISVPPDMAIEIQSPEQSLAQLTTKVPLYFDSGVRMVWIIQPAKKIALVFRPDQAQSETISSDGILDATEAGATGFQVKLTELFAED